MANRDFGQKPVRFREQDTDPKTGKYLTYMNVNLNGVEHRETVAYEPWDPPEEIQRLEMEALDRLERWIKEEGQRQEMAAMGLGYVGP